MDDSTNMPDRSDKSGQALAALAQMMNEQTELVTAMAEASNRSAANEAEARRLASQKDELAQRMLRLQAQMARATQEASGVGSIAAGSTKAGGSTFVGSTIDPSSFGDNSTLGGASSMTGSNPYPDSRYSGGGTYPGEAYHGGHSQGHGTYAGEGSTFPASSYPGSEGYIGDSYGGSYPHSHGYPSSQGFPPSHGHPSSPGYPPYSEYSPGHAYPPPSQGYQRSVGGYPPDQDYPHQQGYVPNRGHPPSHGHPVDYPPMANYPPPHDGRVPPPYVHEGLDNQSLHSHRSSHSHMSRRSQRSHNSRHSHQSGTRNYQLDGYHAEVPHSPNFSGTASVRSGMQHSRRKQNRPQQYDEPLVHVGMQGNPIGHEPVMQHDQAPWHGGLHHSSHSRDRFIQYDDGTYSVGSGKPDVPFMVQAEHGDEYSVGSFSSHRSGHSNRSGRSKRSTGSMRSARSARSSGKSISSGRNSRSGKKKKKSHEFQPPIKEFVREENPPGSATWKIMSKAATCIVPDRLVPREAAATKQAWREKVTICIIALMTSAFIVGGVGFLPVFFCRSSNRKTAEELEKENPAWTVIYGNLYDMTKFQEKHPAGANSIMLYEGKDASKLFPRIPLGLMPEYCLSSNKTKMIQKEFSSPICPDLADEDILNNHYCHTMITGMNEIRFTLEDYWKGELVVPQWELQKGEEDDLMWLRIGTSIYNITNYINSLRDPLTRSINDEASHANAFLHPALHSLVVNKRNQDATLLFEDVFPMEDREAFQSCLDNLFYESRLDDRYDPGCQSVGVLMYFLLFFIAGLLVVQVGCSLLYLARKHRVFHEDDLQAAVMVMVPCYNEGEKELSKTINSLLMTEYPVENKVMCIVADGVVTGSDEEFSTPEICAQILGFEINFQKDDTHKYAATHEFENKRVNFAGVYTGTYVKEVDGQERQLKYIVVVKRGTEAEAGAAKPGNRGKRDSQLVLAGLFNRIHYNREPSELDIALVKSLFSLGLPAKDIEYLMCIDADTRVKEDSMSHMVYHLEHDPLILACCGETQVDNKSDTWVTMIQVFEYYSSHHLKKAFESVFGCVTCLPGCFTTYRVFTDEMKCLISNDEVYIDYARHEIPSLHEKNLFELGEDRMLTTLLLMHFPGMRLSFVPEAICWTIVPHTMKILLSQRRRWINSTFHNMYELLKVETMCGICCLSMKTVVVMDLIVTMILPASLIYIGYLTYLFATEPENIDTFILVFYGVTFGLQMVSFLIRSRFDYLWWFTVFTFLGIPVFYFILPVYAFTNMDDFSWGKTRTVASGGGEGTEDAETPKDEADCGRPESPDTRGDDSVSEGISLGSKRSKSSAKKKVKNF